MTSERRLAANRKNAKRSTGPRTARGKLRVRSNAVQHGLATTAVAASSEAQAHMDMDAAAQDEVLGAMQDGPAVFQRALAEMARYSRYERRALSRRQRAIRTFVATSILGTPPPLFKRASRSPAGMAKPKR